MLKTWTEIKGRLKPSNYVQNTMNLDQKDILTLIGRFLRSCWWLYSDGRGSLKKKSASHFKLHETLGVLKLHSAYLCLVPSYPYITYLLLRIVLQLYLGTCARTILFWGRALFVYLFNWRVHLVNFSSLICVVRDCAHMVGGSS